MYEEFKKIFDRFSFHETAGTEENDNKDESAQNAALSKKSDSDSEEEEQDNQQKEKGVSNKKKKLQRRMKIAELRQICLRPDVVEKDWDLVKQMGENYPSVIPCFGLHPWYVAERTPSWFNTLKENLECTPSAAVGEIGLDKGSRGKEIDFTDQIDVFRQQLELAIEFKRPASIPCVRAFGDLLQIMKRASNSWTHAV